MEVIQSELQSMEVKWKKSEATRLQMKMVVEEYEKAMTQMIGKC